VLKNPFTSKFWKLKKTNKREIFCVIFCSFNRLLENKSNIYFLLRQKMDKKITGANNFFRKKVRFKEHLCKRHKQKLQKYYFVAKSDKKTMHGMYLCS
jgi:hypothetical protein